MKKIGLKILVLSMCLSILTGCSIADKFTEIGNNDNKNNSSADVNKPKDNIATLPIFESPIRTDIEIVDEELRDDTYLNEAIFIGDSICRGISLYGGIDPSRTLAIDGLSTKDLYNKTYPYYGSQYYLIDAVEIDQPKYVYIWMGVNDIKTLSKDDYVRNITGLIENVREVSPNSKICVLSIAPLSEYHEWKANPEIIRFNRAASEAVLGLGLDDIYYLDMWPILRNDNYAMNEIFNSGDNLHMNNYAYTKILAYISKYKLG